MATRRRRYLQAVQEVFDALRGDSSFDPTFDRTVVEDLIDLAPPGLDELFGLLEVVDALDRSYDTVVVDTAPTGHALRLLEMPESALEWVHAFMEILLKYRKVIGLGDLGADLVTLARDLRRLGALLRDPDRARALVVTRAAALPRLETVRLVAALTRLGVTVGGVIVNALTSTAGRAAETLCSRCRQAARAEQGAVKTLVDELSAVERTPTLIVRAPAQVPPPRGVRALSQWQRRWQLTSPPRSEW